MSEIKLPDKVPRFKRFKLNKFIIGICVIFVLLFLVGVFYINKARILQSNQMDNIHDAEFLRKNGYHVSGTQTFLFIIHALITIVFCFVSLWALGSRNYYYKRQKFLEEIIKKHGNNGIFEEKEKLETQHAQQLLRNRGINGINKYKRL